MQTVPTYIGMYYNNIIGQNNEGTAGFQHIVIRFLVHNILVYRMMVLL